jgi:hypothetical protein
MAPELKRDSLKITAHLMRIYSARSRGLEGSRRISTWPAGVPMAASPAGCGHSDLFQCGKLASVMTAGSLSTVPVPCCSLRPSFWHQNTTATALGKLALMVLMMALLLN